MAYYPRKHQLQENIAYHIINRGNGKYDIFHDDEDYTHFKYLLSTYSRLKAMNVYHWVIMSNHYHLLIEITIPEKLSSIIAGINRGYTHYYHKKYKTAGFLWQGRFKSQPIQKDRYLFACGRYIEQNPVRAHMARCAEDYSYSSARYYVIGDHDSLTIESPAYGAFGNSKKERQTRYKEFLLYFDAQDIEWYNDFNRPMGDESFKQRLVKQRGRYFPRRRGRVHRNVAFGL